MTKSRWLTCAAGLACASLVLTITPLTSVFAAPIDTSFKRVSTTPAYSNTSIDQKSVAEISTISPDGNTLYYTDAGGQLVGVMDISDPANVTPAGTIPVGGEPTSVYAYDSYVLVVVDTSKGDFVNPSGKVSVIDAATNEVVTEIDLGGQPDSIDIFGTQAVVAIENQRDEEANDGDLPQLPAGYVALLDLSDPDPANWVRNDVEMTDLPITEPTDPEPEYVKFSPDGSKIAVTLQENNGVAIIDAKTEAVSGWSAGTNTVTDVDTKKDAKISLTGSITDIPREPDSIGWIDNSHVAIANEGDWKGGTRGWTIFGTDGSLVWDSGNSMEYLAIANGHWLDKRANKKGIEPEGLAVAEFDGTRYAFVGSERTNFVAVYDVSNPANPIYKQMLPTTNGPEGILPIPERNLLAISSEEDEPGTPQRATVALYQLSDGAPLYPQVTSDYVDGKPIPWLALGALSSSATPDVLYGASDVALEPNNIYTIDAGQTPARITSAMPVTKDGAPTQYDIEGIWANPAGGFWLGAEGNKKSGKENEFNLLVEVNKDGKVLQEVKLPADIEANLGKWGIEGITGTLDGKTLYVALQRDADKSLPTRILSYDVEHATFNTFVYPLESTSIDGDWMGLSEVSYVGTTADGGVRLAVLERDKQTGPSIAVKRIYEVVISPNAKDGDALTKTLVRDLVPDLRTTSGWSQEKVEGMAVDLTTGNVFVSTDNDGLEDINGETRFFNLGDLFGLKPAEKPVSPTEPTAKPLPKTGA